MILSCIGVPCADTVSSPGELDIARSASICPEERPVLGSLDPALWIKSADRTIFVYQGIGRRLRKKPPVGPPLGSVAAQTGVSAPSSTGRGALEPPMSVWTHPGQTE